MFLELTLAVPTKRKVWLRADAIVAITVWQDETKVSISRSSEDEGIAVMESPEYIMAKVAESVRWNR